MLGVRYISAPTIYPGFDITLRSERELDTFFAILRNVVDSHINSAA